MLGAIAGDIIGSVYEGGRPPGKDFPLFRPASRFSDDTVLIVAVASAILGSHDYAQSIRSWGQRYPGAGYGRWFCTWLFHDSPAPYNSFGNGSAMRVAPVGWAFNSLEQVLTQATQSAEPTHNHPEGIKGAQAIAAAVFLARTGRSKDAIAALISDRFGYNLSASLEALQNTGGIDVTCQQTVPAAVVAFLHSTDFEDAIRNAVSFGGDTDTVACIAGSIAEAFYGDVPLPIQLEALRRVDQTLMSEIKAFADRYRLPMTSHPVPFGQ